MALKEHKWLPDGSESALHHLDLHRKKEGCHCFLWQRANVEKLPCVYHWLRHICSLLPLTCPSQLAFPPLLRSLPSPSSSSTAGPQGGGWIMPGKKFVLLHRHWLSHQGCRPRFHLCESASTSWQLAVGPPFNHSCELIETRELIRPRWTHPRRPMGWGRVALPTSSSLRRAPGGSSRCLTATRLSRRRAPSPSGLPRASGEYSMPTPSPASTSTWVSLLDSGTLAICSVALFFL